MAAQDVAQQRAQVVGESRPRAPGTFGDRPAAGRPPPRAPARWRAPSARPARHDPRAARRSRPGAGPGGRSPGPSGSSSARRASRWSVSASSGSSRSQPDLEAASAPRRPRPCGVPGAPRHQVAEAAQLVLLLRHRPGRRAPAARRRSRSPAPDELPGAGVRARPARASRARSRRRPPAAARSAARAKRWRASARRARVAGEPSGHHGPARWAPSTARGPDHTASRGASATAVAADQRQPTGQRHLLGDDVQSVHRDQDRDQRAALVHRALEFHVGARRSAARRTRTRSPRRTSRPGRRAAQRRARALSVPGDPRLAADAQVGVDAAQALERPAGAARRWEARRATPSAVADEVGGQRAVAVERGVGPGRLDDLEGDLGPAGRIAPRAGTTPARRSRAESACRTRLRMPGRRFAAPAPLPAARASRPRRRPARRPALRRPASSQLPSSLSQRYP